MPNEKEISNLKIRKKKPSHILPEIKKLNLSEDIDEFYLVLAVIFNDLMGIIAFYRFVEQHRKPEVGEVSSHAGDYNALRVQLLKILISYFNEVTLFLRKNEDMLKHDKIMTHIRALNESDQYVLKKLYALAEIQSEVDLTEEGKKFVEFFLKVRNNAGYHYYQSGQNLTAGFRYHFFEIDNTTNLQNKFAYYSYRRSEFDAIRYYYADAAVDGYIAKCALEVGLGSIEKVIKLIFEYTVETSRVISRLLESYLDEKPNV